MSKRLMVVALMTTLSILSACQAAGKNPDNVKIPILEAMRIVSLMQDGYRDKANIRLLQAQRKY